MHKTILVKLCVQDVDKIRLRATFVDYQIAWQFVSDWIFANKTKNRGKVHSATYQSVRNTVPNLNSGLVQQARNDAIAKFKSVSSNKHKISISPKLKNVSIRYDNRNSKLYGNVLTFSVNGGKRIKTELVDYPRLQQHRNYKLLAPLIFFRDNNYWAALTFDVPEAIVQNGNLIGVDLGLRILAATSEGKLLRGEKMNRLRRKSRYIKGELQRKGTKSAKRHLRRLRRKEKRQSRDVIHCSVNEVLKTNASLIAVEDLDLRARKYRKSSNRRRFSIPLSEFIRVLEYKGKLCGKQIVKVSPAYTSQDDCRGLSPGKRIGGKYIGIDGRILQADLNAACNIANKAKDALKLNNPVSLCYAQINGQAAVNPPIVGGSRSQAAIPLGGGD